MDPLPKSQWLTLGDHQALTRVQMKATEKKGWDGNTTQLTDPWTEAMQRKHKEANTLKYKTKI